MSHRVRGAGVARALLDLVLPLTCAGCGGPGARWCGACDGSLPALPQPVRLRHDPLVPVFAAGPYEGRMRAAVVAMKAAGRHDLAGPLGGVLARAVTALRELGEVDPPHLAPLVLVPVPSRPLVARRRGADLMALVAESAAGALNRRGEGGGEGAAVRAPLRMRFGVRDSAGLAAVARARNLAGRVRFTGDRAAWHGCAVVLVDDVVTTGATARECVRALAEGGVRVRAVVDLASA